MTLDIRRGTELLRKLHQLNAEFRPRQVVVELLGGTQSARAATTFGVVTGVLAAFLEQTKLPLCLITARNAKKRMTGSFSASKAAMIKVAEKAEPTLFQRAGFKPSKKGKWPNDVEHVADAYALFRTALEGPELRQLLQVLTELQPQPQVDNKEDGFD
jgi:hypothetical protein